MDKPLIPHVHMNGTSTEELANQQFKVLQATYPLMIALRNAAPHKRDFYPIFDQETFDRACKYHREQVQAVMRIHEAANSILEGIISQLHQGK